jgi:hypothetical protein
MRLCRLFYAQIMLLLSFTPHSILDLKLSEGTEKCGSCFFVCHENREFRYYPKFVCPPLLLTRVFAHPWLWVLYAFVVSYVTVYYVIEIIYIFYYIIHWCCICFFSFNFLSQWCKRNKTYKASFSETYAKGLLFQQTVRFGLFCRKLNIRLIK